jgi:hypothetical protein
MTKGGNNGSGKDYTVTSSGTNSQVWMTSTVEPRSSPCIDRETTTVTARLGPPAATTTLIREPRGHHSYYHC